MLSNTCQKCQKPMNGGVYKAAHQCPNCFHEHDNIQKKRRTRAKIKTSAEPSIPLEAALDAVLETALSSYISDNKTSVTATTEPTNNRSKTTAEQYTEMQVGVAADSLELVIPEALPMAATKIEHALKKGKAPATGNVKNNANKIIPEDSDSTLLFGDVYSTPTPSSNRPEFSLAAITQRLDNNAPEQKATHEKPQDKKLLEPLTKKPFNTKETDEPRIQKEPQDKQTEPLEVVATAPRLPTKTEVSMPASQEPLQDNAEDNAPPSKNGTQENSLYKKVVLTTEKLHNLAVTERLEVISADYIFGMNIVKDLFSEGKFVGGRSHATQTALKQARAAVLDELRKDSYAIGANAVVGVDLKQKVEMGDGGNAMLFISATGTAVKAKAS